MEEIYQLKRELDSLKKQKDIIIRVFLITTVLAQIVYTCKTEQAAYFVLTLFLIDVTAFSLLFYKLHIDEKQMLDTLQKRINEEKRKIDTCLKKQTES